MRASEKGGYVKDIRPTIIGQFQPSSSPVDATPTTTSRIATLAVPFVSRPRPYELLPTPPPNPARLPLTPFSFSIPDPVVPPPFPPIMASRLKSLATMAQSAAASDLVVKSSTAAAFETTAALRRQYVASSLNAMPARVDAAAAEWASVKSKVMERSFTFGEFATGVVAGVELYACYIVGRAMGGRTIEQEL